MPITDAVIYIAFDEGTGSAAANAGSGGSTYDLTISGTASWQTGSVGGALRVTDSSFASANNVAVPFTGDHTMSCRVKTPDLPDEFSEWLLVMVGWRDAAGIFDALYSLRAGNNGMMLGAARDSANGTVSTDSSPATYDNDAWHTVSYRYTSATALIELFVDGVEVKSTDGTGSGIFDFFGIGNPAQVRVGGMGQTFDIDEFRVFDRVLNDSEMAELHSFTGDTPAEPITATASILEAADTTASAAALLIRATASILEAPDTCRATGDNAAEPAFTPVSRKRSGGARSVLVQRREGEPEAEQEEPEEPAQRPKRKRRPVEAGNSSVPLEALPDPYGVLFHDQRPTQSSQRLPQPKFTRKQEALSLEEDDEEAIALLLS